MTGVAAFLLYACVVTPALPSIHSPGRIADAILAVTVLLVVIPIAVIDLFNLIIPDKLTLPLLGGAALLSFLPGGTTPLQCGLGILAGGGSLFLVGLVGEYAFKKGEAMGGGDVKLMALVGAVFGWKNAFLTIMLAAFIGSIGGFLMITLKRFAKGHKIPFGPFLSVSLWIAVLGGHRLVTFYFSLFDRLMR
jgi:leader peptidase (prepilin peptidase)/N-methyltransferase